MTRGRVWRAALLLWIVVIAGLLAVDAFWHPQPKPPTASKLLFHDHLSATSSGRPSLPDQFEGRAHYPSLALAVGLPATPAQGSVFESDPTLGPTPAQVGHVWGVDVQPSVVDSQATIGDIQYFPSSGVIDYERPTNPQSVRVPGPGLFPHSIANAQDAIGMARDFVLSRGLFSAAEVTAMRTTAERSTAFDGNVPMWTIQLIRTLAGVPDYGSRTPGATFRVADNGRIDSIVIGHRTISGSEPVHLIDASEAWHQITLGHWYASDLLLGGSNPQQPPFLADQAELCYHEEDQNTPQEWLMPMWCFADTKTAPGFPVRLYYPALPAGSFDWTVPSH